MGTAEEMEMLRDMLGIEEYNVFIKEYKEHQNEIKIGLNISNENKLSLIVDKVLSKRLKSNKKRGTMEELGDYDEFMSYDEDERNLNNWDVVNDEEEDVLTENDGNESEQDEVFKKLEKNIGDDLVNKEYDVPSKDIKKGLFDNESEDEDEDALWNISDDDEEDEDDEDQNVRIKNKKGE